MKKSETFEKQIHRIHELLEGPGVEVTWDYYVADPDNPSQLRQIDIAIVRDGRLTIVECRHHESRQDVQWIEELIGRRTSLAADGAVAVSSSGFTAGALKKANRFGIITHDLRRLTESEVKSWGRQVNLTLYFYQYSDLELCLIFEPESIPKLDANAVSSEIQSHPALQSLFNAAAKQLDGLNLLGRGCTDAIQFRLRVELEQFRVSGETVLHVDFSGKARLSSSALTSPGVFGYEKPEVDSRVAQATVEAFSLGDTSIVHDDASKISIFLDLSQLNPPPLCQFRFFRIDGETEMDHEVLEIGGLDKLRIGGPLTVRICSELASS
jgi:restriction endonuclease